MSDLALAQAKGDLSDEDRHKVLHQLSKPLKTLAGFGKEQSMTFAQEALALACFVIFPSCIFWVPAVLIGSAVACFRMGNTAAALWAGAVLLIAFWPLKRWHGFLRARLAPLLFRYNSLVMAWEEPLVKGSPYIIVAPPHGVLPLANLFSLLAFPNLWGFPFTGLTADAALRLPVMRQMMTWLGCDSANARVSVLRLSGLFWFQLLQLRAHHLMLLCIMRCCCDRRMRTSC